MALEAFVLSPRRLATFEEWQKAIDSSGWPLVLSQETDFSEVDGFLPVMWKGRNSGFECAHWERDDIEDLIVGHNVSREFRNVLAFRWGRDFHESISVVQASAAYAKATSGVVFDSEDGKLRTPVEMAEMAVQIEAFLPEIEAALKKYRNEE